MLPAISSCIFLTLLTQCCFGHGFGLSLRVDLMLCMQLQWHELCVSESAVSGSRPHRLDESGICHLLLKQRTVRKMLLLLMCGGALHLNRLVTSAKGTTRKDNV